MGTIFLQNEKMLKNDIFSISNEVQWFWVVLACDEKWKRPYHFIAFNFSDGYDLILLDDSEKEKFCELFSNYLKLKRMDETGLKERHLICLDYVYVDSKASYTSDFLIDLENETIKSTERFSDNGGLPFISKDDLIQEYDLYAYVENALEDRFKKHLVREALRFNKSFTKIILA